MLAGVPIVVVKCCMFYSVMVIIPSSYPKTVCKNSSNKSTLWFLYYFTVALNYMPPNMLALNVSYIDRRKNDNFENGIWFNLIFFVRATHCRYIFFPTVPQVINNVKDLPISILSPTFTVTNYNKKKYCISPSGFQISRISSGYTL